MLTPKLQTFSRIIPMIYAYSHPDYPPHAGWTKIGYTDKQTVEERVKQQHHTADIAYKILWRDNAMYKDGSGEYFDDHAFHTYLTAQKKVERKPKTEWFHLSGTDARTMFDEFASRSIPIPDTGIEYTLRHEQAEAVRVTKAYFEQGGTQFLWNAKPRFGKTLTAYDLIRQMGFVNVLIVTNRPSIANSWAEDFQKFIAWRGEMCFVSDTDALAGKAGVMTRREYLSAIDAFQTEKPPSMVAFESLQGLKGSVYFGGQYDKLAWMAKEYTDQFGKKQQGIFFDLLIVDEAQEGVDTIRTDRAFANIQRKHTLYLSGTPFKQLASEQFSKDEIFNWSYADEQQAKQSWKEEGYNPYEALPKLSMFTYQLSPMIYEKVQKGLELSEEDTVDYAFDLNEFFATNESGKFVHEADIRKFLHTLTTGEKYPFSTPQLRQELSHTLWLLNRVASAKALAKLLRDAEFADMFGEYEIVLAAGDGKLSADDLAEVAFDRVKKAIATNEKTITLSVGQLTVGVTIPEWSGVLMLCNMQSPSSYIQAAFRAQNPCVLIKEGQLFRKETAYVFDFDPARTLMILDEFANNLATNTAAGRGTGDERKVNIKRLLNFFPVLGEDSEGKMVELDATAVLSIPRRLKSQEVVRHGFMSNFLFQNISNVFGAPSMVQEIMKKLTPAQEDPKKRDQQALKHIADVQVDPNGEVEIPNAIVIGKTQGLFGAKFYEAKEKELAPQITALAQSTNALQLEQQVKTVVDTIKAKVVQDVVAPIMDEYGVKKSVQGRIERQVERDIERKFEKIQSDYAQKATIAKTEFERRQREVDTQAQLQAAEKDFQAEMDTAMKTLVKAMQDSVQQTIAEKPQEVVEQMERHQKEQEKTAVEDSIRAHLRGFSRTIPSFIMAYGDENLTLANFDAYTEDDVFEKVTGITEQDFRFLRDGGDYPNPETGKTEHFDGHLFDEVAFNDSIKAFWQKKLELADYFDEAQQEDIFDYIPPQKTNQIFTPKWVVQKMVDELEQNNPGCFDDPTKTFADLYMKSGLYITEIVKRLFRSDGLKKAFPNDKERICHILRNQVYGMAPTRIIYLIATNYILGFDKQLKDETTHFVQADATKAAQDGTLEALLAQHFGG